jgi:hypothetical protein
VGTGKELSTGATRRRPPLLLRHETEIGAVVDAETTFSHSTKPCSPDIERQEIESREIECQEIECQEIERQEIEHPRGQPLSVPENEALVTWVRSVAWGTSGPVTLALDLVLYLSPSQQPVVAAVVVSLP